MSKSEETKYQIEATIDSFDLKSGGLRLRGVSKYCFESENKKDKKKEYWNIFENTKNMTDSKFKPQSEPIKLDTSKRWTEIRHLLCHAFTEKRKLKFELSCNSASKLAEYTIIGVSHVST